MARPTKYTAATVARLLEALRLGAPRSLACAAAGIGVQTLADWQRRYRDFRELVESAEVEAALVALQRIQAAADRGAWRAAAWYLERRFPADFGRRAGLVDIEARLRAAALAAGIDPEAAVEEARLLVRVVYDGEA